MKKLLPLFLLFIYSLGYTAQGSRYDNGLIYLMHFNEGKGSVTYDSVNQATSTLNGELDIAGWLQFGGLYGACLNYDGINDYVQTASLNFSAMPEKSIEAWIYFSSECLVLSGRIIVLHASAWDSNKYCGLLMGGASGDGKIHLYQSTGTTGSGTLYIKYNTVLNINKWYHIVGTISKSNGIMQLYVNGVLQAVSYPSISQLAIQSTVFYDPPTNWTARIGGGNTGRPFVGKIDEVRVYNRVLTKGEIQSHYKCNSKSITVN